MQIGQKLNAHGAVIGALLGLLMHCKPVRAVCPRRSATKIRRL